MNYETAIYYPYTNVRDDNWLARNALYWDEIYLICPDEKKPYSTSFQQELYEAGVLKKQGHLQKHAELASESFLDNCQNKSFMSNVSNYITSKMNFQSLNDLLKENKKNSKNLYKNRELMKFLARTFEYVHMGKIPILENQENGGILHNEDLLYELSHEIEYILRKLKYDFDFFELFDRARLLENRSGGHTTSNSVLMIKPLADMYLLTLASEVSKEQGKSILTDSVDIFPVNNSLFGYYHLSKNGDIPHLMIDIALKRIPMVREVNAKKLLKFRKKYRSELLAFRSAMSELIDEAKKAEDIRDLKYRCENITATKIEKSVKNIEKSLKSIRNPINWELDVQQMTGLITFGIGFSWEGLEQFAFHILGGAMTLKGAIKGYSDRVETIREKPFSYLQRLHKVRW